VTGRTPGPLVILGATGSIGASALEVAAELGDRVELVGLSCNRGWRELAALAARWRPRAVAVADEGAWREARAAAVEPVLGQKGELEFRWVTVILLAERGDAAARPAVPPEAGSGARRCIG